jgi:hypothetical protein
VKRLELATIAYGQPWLIAEQLRLLEKYLEDDHLVLVIDNSDVGEGSAEVAEVAKAVDYVRPAREHYMALNFAARAFRFRGSEFFGFLDHDVFPTRPTRVLPALERDGFLGMGQRISTTGELYPWPGLFFVSTAWLAGRQLDFGSRGFGDAGSGLATLFTEADWPKLHSLPHVPRAIREHDDVGFQSWGVEEIGDWLHLSNGSGWMSVPRPEEREAKLREIVAAL